MSVYVDDMAAGFGRMVMCHMIADTRVELDAMADAIGVARKWRQSAGTPTEHYDICKAKRSQAIARGAIPISMRELAVKTRARRGDGWESYAPSTERNTPR